MRGPALRSSYFPPSLRSAEGDSSRFAKCYHLTRSQDSLLAMCVRCHCVCEANHDSSKLCDAARTFFIDSVSLTSPAVTNFHNPIWCRVNCDERRPMVELTWYKLNFAVLNDGSPIVSRGHNCGCCFGCFGCTELFRPNILFTQLMFVSDMAGRH